MPDKIQYDLAMTSQKLYELEQASEKSITITLSDDQLGKLKAQNYKMCFAKKVGDKGYNVVWQSYGVFLNETSFNWTPEYEIFGSNQFQESMTVSAKTRLVPVALGQKVTLLSSGVFGPVTSGPECDPLAITFVSEYDSIHPGINQLVSMDGQGKKSMPIYVAPSAVLTKTTTLLTPKETVLVWFEQNIETSTMFSNSRSLSVELDLTHASSAKAEYRDGQWYQS